MPQRPLELRQGNAARPPNPPTPPLPGSDTLPDPHWRFGPIQWQQPLPEFILGHGGELPLLPLLPLPLTLNLPLPGLRLLPDAIRFYQSLRDTMDNSLLMQACREGHVELVMFLLEGCPPSYAQMLNIAGQNAAMIARDHDHPALLALLQQAGVELQPDNPALHWYLQHRSDLSTAATMQDWQPLAALLAQDHFMNLRDANGRTLLFHAVMNADLEAIRFLCGCLDGPYLGWKDADDHSVFRYTTRIPNVEIGAAICQELRTYRRRTRGHHRRARYGNGVVPVVEFTDPKVRQLVNETSTPDANSTLK